MREALVPGDACCGEGAIIEIRETRKVPLPVVIVSPALHGACENCKKPERIAVLLCCCDFLTRVLDFYLICFCGLLEPWSLVARIRRGWKLCGRRNPGKVVGILERIGAV